MSVNTDNLKANLSLLPEFKTSPLLLSPIRNKLSDD